jgi:hypothetical protein
MAGIIQLRRDTAANWTAANPVLEFGEKGLEVDTGREKNGDGVTEWNDLPYVDAAAAAAGAAASAGLAAHLADTVDAHDASAISLTPIAGLGNPATVQEALAAVPGRFGSGTINTVPSDVAPRVTQGLYQRTRPLADPGGGGQPIRPVCVDPNVPGRIWAVGSAFGQIGHSDDNGLTFTPRTANPGSPMGVQSMVISGGFAWLTLGGTTSRSGQIWRSPAPAANGTGLTWTKIFDLTGLVNGPGGAAGDGGVNSNFRNSCFAVNGQHGYALEYSINTITGGTRLYYSSNVNTATPGNVTWTVARTWTDAKHGHAVKVIGGVPWVTLGDATFSDLGVWTATAANAAVWNRRSLLGEINNGTYEYGINFFPTTIGGQQVVVMEYDGYGPAGPLIHASQDPTQPRPSRKMCEVPYPYIGSMRALTRTSEGNFMWVTTCEGGAIGNLDSIWILGDPYTTPVLLESFDGTAQPLGTIGDPIEMGDFIWFGRDRIRKEKFIGQ